MLSFIFSARYPQPVKKLILIGSGPYEDKYAADIMKTRLNRLGEDDPEEFIHLAEALGNPSAENRNEILSSYGELISKADAYDLLFGHLKNFKFILLERCGHKPWIEKKAKERFYEVLKQEIQTNRP